MKQLRPGLTLVLAVAACSGDAPGPTSEGPSSEAGFTAMSVAVGGLTTCALQDDLVLHCWGRFSSTYIEAEPDTVNCRSSLFGCYLRPTVVDSSFPVRSLEVGGDYFAAHVCGVGLGGTIECIGAFRALEDLVIGVGSDALTIAGYMTSVSADWAHWCGLEQGGLVLCWGQRAYGKRGLPYLEYADQWDLVANVIADPQFTAVTVGRSHSCGIAVDGLTYCWGQAGAVGRPSPPTAPPDQCLSGPDCVIDPVPLVHLLQFNAIDAGGGHTCGLTAAGDLYCWGDGSLGQLGNGTADALAPVKVALPAPITMFSAGGSHTCAVTTDRRLYCWGLSEALGLEGRTPVSVPTEVDHDRDYIDLSAGGNHTCARDSEWRVFCWGWNAYGQLGTGDTLSRSRPTAVLTP